MTKDPNNNDQTAAPAAEKPKVAAAAKKTDKKTSDGGPKVLTKNVMGRALQLSKRTFIVVGIFSIFINLLMLVSPLYMLQIYDRVLTSQSVETLIAITVLAVFLLGMFALLEILRNRILNRFSMALDSTVGDDVFDSVFQQGLVSNGRMGSGLLRDIEAVRQFVTTPALTAFFDTPWVPFYIAINFVLHPYMGWLSIFGGVMIFTLAIITELSSRTLLRQSQAVHAHSNQFASSSLRNIDVLQAMGMLNNVRRRWRKNHQMGVNLQTRANIRIGQLLGAYKGLRMTLQVLVLGLGGYLVLNNELSPGLMIAGSIIMGRALAPVEQAIGAWRNFVLARQSYRRLKPILSNMNDQADSIALPRPVGRIAVSNLYAAPPGVKQPIIKQISFNVEPGEVLGIVGPSAAGKSTLARLLVGVWAPLGGTVRLDNIDISKWDPQDKGKYVGYLPQTIELFEGTVVDNIARFTEPDNEQVFRATRIARCHDMILKLPKGYDTPIGEAGAFLSGGQKQRIALARALYNNPPLLVLDEPNANLDEEGEVALNSAVNDMRANGSAIIIISHRQVNILTKIMVLQQGSIADYGPANEVLQRLHNAAREKMAQAQKSAS